MSQGRKSLNTEKKRRCTDCGKPTNNYRCTECWELLKAAGEISDNSGYAPETSGSFLTGRSVGSVLEKYGAR